jgi:hypothetical protein
MNDRIDKNWLKLIRTSPNKIITQKGLKTTQVYIDSSKIYSLQAEYMKLYNTEKFNIDSFLTSVMNWNPDDLTTPGNLPEEKQYLRYFLPGEYGGLHQKDFQSWTVKDPDTNVWIMTVWSMPNSEKFDTPLYPFHHPGLDNKLDHFRHYLLQTGIPMGILFNGENLRLVYVEAGIAHSGWIDFDIKDMMASDGAIILAGLESLLNDARMFNVPVDRRLINIIRNSK